jgi:membrane-associated phospholipid phosphatase
MERPFPRIEKWFFVPPVICIVLLAMANWSGHDVQIFLRLNQLGHFGGDYFWIGVTTFGDGLVLFVLTLPFVRRKPALAWSLILTWLLIALWIKVLKSLIVTYRPLSVLDPASFRLVGAAYRYNSFPSGHATSVAAFVATLCIFFRRIWVRSALVSLAVLVAFSRLAMGVHWATDVLAGFAAGWVTAMVAFSLSRRLKFGTSRRAQLIFLLILSGAAIGMLLVNYTDYPQSFRLLQTIALACIVFTAGDYLLAWRKQKSVAITETTAASSVPAFPQNPQGTNRSATSLDERTS